jgi:hypothetical protein
MNDLGGYDPGPTFAKLLAIFGSDSNLELFLNDYFASRLWPKFFGVY